MKYDLFKRATSGYPKFNHRLCNGICHYESGYFPVYLDKIIRSALGDLVPGLVYKGYRYLTPMEEYHNAVSWASNKVKAWEITRTDARFIRFLFEYTPPTTSHLKQKTTEHFRDIYIPFINEGDVIYSNGVMYTARPIIGDRSFNVDKGNLYISLPRIRLSFHKIVYGLQVYDKQHPLGIIKHVDVVHSRHYSVRKPDQMSNYKLTLVHYLLIAYGVTGLFRTFYGIEPIIGTIEEEGLLYDEHQDYILFESRGYKNMSNVKKKKKCKIFIGVKRSEYEPSMDNIIAGIFYILDTSLENSQPEDLDDKDLWFRVLPFYIFNESIATQNSEHNQGKMQEHYQGFLKYVDLVSQENFKKDGYRITNSLEMFFYVITNYSRILMTIDAGSMYYKILNVTKYILYDIVEDIFNNMYKLTNRSRKSKKHTFVFARELPLSYKYKINISSPKHMETISDPFATDNKVFRTTLNAITQTKALGAKSPHHNASNEWLCVHHSQLEVNSVSMLTKNDFIARGKLNPFVHIDGDIPMIIPNPKLEPIIDNVRQLLGYKKYPTLHERVDEKWQERS